MSDFLPFLSALTGGFMRGNQILQNRKINEAKLQREQARDAALAADRAADRELRGKQYDLSLKQFEEALRSGKESTLRGRASDFTKSWENAFDPVKEFTKAITDKKYSNIEEAQSARDRARADLYHNLLGLGDRYNQNNLSDFFENQSFINYLRANSRGFQDFIPSNIADLLEKTTTTPRYEYGSNFKYDPSKPPSSGDMSSALGQNLKALEQLSKYAPGSAEQQSWASQLAPGIIETYGKVGLQPPAWTQQVEIPGIDPNQRIRPITDPLGKSEFSPYLLSDKSRFAQGLPVSAETQPRKIFTPVPMDPIVAANLEAKKASTERTRQIIDFRDKIDPFEIEGKKLSVKMKGLQIEYFKPIADAKIALQNALTYKANVETDFISPNYQTRKRFADAAVANTYNNLVEIASKTASSAQGAIADWDKTNAPLLANKSNQRNVAQRIADILDKPAAQRTPDDNNFLSKNGQFSRQNSSLITMLRERNALVERYNMARVTMQNTEKSRKQYFGKFMPYGADPYGGVPAGIMQRSEGLPLINSVIVPDFVYDGAVGFGSGNLGGSNIIFPE